VSATHRSASRVVSALVTPLGIIAAVTLWRVVAAWVTPVAQDEAYYYDWARSLAAGYFDHPPGVALLGLGTQLLPGSPLAARLGTLLVSTLTLLALWRLYYVCGIRQQPLLSLSLLLAAASLPGLVSGVLTTPDTLLALFWAIALHEALAALPREQRAQRWRWLSAGAATVPITTKPPTQSPRASVWRKWSVRKLQLGMSLSPARSCPE